MGRKSSEKRRRRTDPTYRARVVGQRAEQIGRQVQPTVEAYKAAARAGGPHAVVRALISRHNQRWENIRGSIPRLSDPLAETLHVAFPLDVALWRLGVRFTEPPSFGFGEWPEQLRWGIDSACQVQRMILAGNAMGAAAVARTQFERWSSNRATSNNLLKEEDVATSDFLTEIWSHEAPAHEGGRVWAELSELLHGRGPLVDGVRWEASDLARPTEVGRVLPAVDLIETATQLSLRQVLLCVVSLVNDSDEFPPEMGRALLPMPLSLPSEVYLREASPSVWPMTLDYVSQFKHLVADDPYLRDVETLGAGGVPRPLVYSARSFEAYRSRRTRACATAAWAFEQEAEQLGDDFDPAALEQRALAYIVINEAAAVLASWMPSGPAPDALVVGSAALRSAFWLWLEDDERAMLLARSVLEQSARLRAWRTKPTKAAAVESRGSRGSSRDWLEAAGWRRLSILNKSLGHFSHATPSTVRWSGARDVLATIQPEVQISGWRPEQTGRGSALNQVAFAFGSEVLDWALAEEPVVAEALAAVLPYGADDNAPGEIDEWLERCWGHRSLSFGTPDFEAPPR